jgi:hypothetical protein
MTEAVSARGRCWAADTTLIEKMRGGFKHFTICLRSCRPPFAFHLPRCDRKQFTVLCRAVIRVVSCCAAGRSEVLLYCTLPVTDHPESDWGNLVVLAPVRVNRVVLNSS